MNQRLTAIDTLQNTLGYRFTDPKRLETALTHASVAEGAHKIADNERLEFLGDRVLGLIMAEALMRAYPEASEGELSRHFHALVSRDACAEVARRLGLGAALRLAAGESKGGGRDNPTILGDAMEALIAALYLEAGLTRTVDIIAPLWAERIRDQATAFSANPKSFLQEWAAAKKIAAPVYTLAGRKGPDHAPVFTIELTLPGYAAVSAKGRSRQEAEKACALTFISREGLN